MTGHLDYVEAPPREALRPWVRSVWTYGRSEADEEPQRIPGDGCAELIVHLGVPHDEIDAHGRARRQPPVMFVGQLTQPLRIQAPGPTRVFAVRFEPDGAYAWLKRSLRTATDRRLDMAELRPEWTARLLDALRGAADPLAALEAAVATDLENASPPDPDVRAAVAAVIDDLPVARDRRLQRRFLERVGISARMLRSVLRFRRVFDAMEADRQAGWVAAALAAGYFDQPQMARDFRRFLDCTASDWARQKVSLAHALVSQSYKLETAPGG